MKKIILATIITVILIGGFFTAITYGNRKNSQANCKNFIFDPTVHTVVNIGTADAIFPESFEEMEATVRKYGQIIALCEVVGPSMNRIIDPPIKDRNPNAVYGSNHVLTPIKILKIIYQGETFHLKEGEVYYVGEHFYYVTEETPDQLEYYPMHTVITSNGYEPMEQGKIYLAYIGEVEAEIYYFEGKPTLCVYGFGIGNFDLSTTRSVSRDTSNRYTDFMWPEVMARYGSMAEEIQQSRSAQNTERQ